jgi:hypothetical protein
MGGTWTMKAIACLAVAVCTAIAFGQPASAAPRQHRCHLGNGIEHVFYLQFDNVHLRRDNPNVPSDLEQMPNLLNFLEGEGTLFTKHYTPLISHTSVDILTALTGVYGDKLGVSIGNSFGLFDANGVASFPSSFTYWTDVLADGKYEMLDQRGKNAPAAWVPFTRAGCDVGAFSIANLEFENVTSDIDNVFGPTSPQHQEATTDFNKAVADFEGIIVHCAQNSPICGKSGAPDILKDEPGGYTGFTALYGDANVQPRISPQGPVTDLDGNVIADSHGNPGFPGFSPSASQSLGYLATMLEAGVPVVYGYISDAHDNQITGSGTFGPGESGYVQQLAAYDQAFGKFFARLAKAGSQRAIRSSSLPPMRTIISLAGRPRQQIATASSHPAPMRRRARSTPISAWCSPPSSATRHRSKCTATTLRPFISMAIPVRLLSRPAP